MRDAAFRRFPARAVRRHGPRSRQRRVHHLRRAAARTQLERWTRVLGIPRVKIKIGESWGTEQARDLARIAFARHVIGPDAELYVDANGGYTPSTWFRMAAHGAALRHVVR